MAKTILRVDLDEEDAKKFYALKEKIGVKNNTEVIRILIEKASLIEAIV